MSRLTPPGASNTVRGRRRQYRRRESIVVWAGAGLGSVVAVFTALRFADHAHVPAALLPVVPIAVVLGGFCLAWARVEFEWLGELLDRGVEDGEFAADAALPAAYQPYPERAEALYYLELLFTAIAGVAVSIIAVWSAT